MSRLYDAQLLAATYGVTVESLRFYEERGLLWPVLLHGVRHYTPRDRVRLEIVLKGKRLGFSLAEIEKMVLGSTGAPGGVQAASGQSRKGQSFEPDLDRVIEELRALIGRRDGLDLSIKELKARLSAK